MGGLSKVSQRVIVVEDDLLNRMLFCTWLEDRACVVDEFSDGRDVCETARAVQPDLFVVDICLPEVSGVELISSSSPTPRSAGSRSSPSPAMQPRKTRRASARPGRATTCASR